MKKNIILKKCPFCNGMAKITSITNKKISPKLYAVSCFFCSISTGWYADKKQAASAWNHRKSVDIKKSGVIIEFLKQEVKKIKSSQKYAIKDRDWHYVFSADLFLKLLNSWIDSLE